MENHNLLMELDKSSFLINAISCIEVHIKKKHNNVIFSYDNKYDAYVIK